jgi:excisionase family DNA binding protein
MNRDDFPMAIPSDAATGPLPPEICRPVDLARELGLSSRSIYEYIRRGQLPGVRTLGRSVLIHRPTVLRWIADGQGGVPRSRRR